MQNQILIWILEIINLRINDEKNLISRAPSEVSKILGVRLQTQRYARSLLEAQF